MMDPLLPIAFGIFLVVVLLLIRWKWRAQELAFYKRAQRWARKKCCLFAIAQTGARQASLRSEFREAPGVELEQKESLDDHLDNLTKKLAEKEGRLRISRSKIREAQCEIDNLHSIDGDVREKYREVMDSLRSDLTENERECKRLQEQIEWVSRRRAEIRDDVRKGQKLFGEAAAELANNLTELQRGRAAPIKPGPQPQSWARRRRDTVQPAQPAHSYIRPLYYPPAVGSSK